MTIAPPLRSALRRSARAAGFRVALLLLAPLAAAAAVTPDAPHPRAVASPAYRVAADGLPVFTEQFKDVHYAAFTFTGRVEVTVRASAPIRRSAVSPRAAGVAAAVEGDTLRLSLDRPRRLVVTLNDGERLFLFADAPDPAAPAPGQPGVTSVTDLGVDATGARLETARLQAAIDRVAAAHGVLYFPPGVYLTGTLSLKSHLTLYLAAGALLLGSDRPADYPVDPGHREPETLADARTWSNLGSDMTFSRLLLVDQATHVRVAGRGVIDGQGRIIRGLGRPPNLVRIRSSSHVTFADVILRDPAAWNSHLLASDHVTYRGVRILNDRSVPNTDGIDPDSSRDVLIESCFIYSGDDPIAIKTSGNAGLLRPVERVTVRGNIFLTHTSAMKLGSESRADIRDVLFADNDVLEADRAITLSCMDGARYERIRFVDNRVERLLFKTQQRPLLIHVRRRQPAAPVGLIRDVLIRDLTVDDPGPNPSRIAGFAADHAAAGIRFERLTIAGRVRTSAADAGIELGPYTQDVTFHPSSPAP
ncbi:MAG: hypothetical protein JNG83_09435 [Opitutaceae bacterium]|nr:hypothetical protein [Opitutaceae bacterium]